MFTHSGRTAAVGVASGVLMVGLSLVPSQAAAPPLTGPSDGATVKVAVTGLPAKYSKKSMVKLIGPVGNHKIRTWKVGTGGTVVGLKAGMYAVSAKWVVRTKAGSIAPDSYEQWITVAEKGAVKARVRYSALRPGIIIPPPHDWFDIDMDAACRYLTGQDTAKAFNHGGAYSWYCVWEDSHSSGMNLNDYCRWWQSNGNAWMAFNHKGTVQWYCGFNSGE